jgi:hypothetical protein
VVVIEGIKVKAKSIPKPQLVLIWKTLTREPFPKVKALQLTDDDFDRIIRLRRCEEDELRELEEWSRILPTEGTDACVFNVDASTNCEYLILVREKPYHSLKEILKHELSHIARGDL